MLRILLLCTALCASWGVSLADYQCVCVYSAEEPVRIMMSEASSTIGSMYEFDCKATVGAQTGDWIAVAFSHQVGYIHASLNAELQTCQGDVPTDDIITTIGASPPTTHAQTTTTHAQTTTTHVRTTTTHAPVSSHRTTVHHTATHATTTHAPYKYTACPSSIHLATARNSGYSFVYQDKCFEIVPTARSWIDAEADCHRRGGFLADIGSANEQSAISAQLNHYYNKSVWIGFHDQTKEGRFRWISGADVTYKHWQNHIHNNVTRLTQDCGMMVAAHSYHWNDAVCTDHHSYICQFHMPAAYQDGNTTLCPNSVRLYHRRHSHVTILSQHGHKCYMLVESRSTWMDAEAACHAKGGHLVHVNSGNEQQFVSRFMHRHNISTSVWIGLTDSGKEGSFTWTDGVHSSYTHFAADSHNNYVGHQAEDCVIINPYQQYQWDDMPCDNKEFHFYICEFATRTITHGGSAIIG